MKICGIQKLDCMKKAESDLLMSGAADACNCLPHCNTIIYDIVSDQSELHLPKMYFIDFAIKNVEK